MAFVEAGIVLGSLTVSWAMVATIASVAYQVQQSKKMRKAAQDAAEARKGFELVTNGSAQSLPIVYGRAKVGGARVWHKTSSKFNYQAGVTNKTFLAGGAPYAATTREDVIDGDGNTQIVNVPASAGATLDKSWSGANNKFLFFQQAICQAPINAVLDVIINDEFRYNDTRFGEGNDSDLKAALRIDCEYFGQSVNSVIAANDPTRASAKFSGAANASVCIALNRDDPQFNGVPDIQFIIEGRPVGYINGSGNSVSYSKTWNSTTKQWTGSSAYTTNPVLCLLDYLLDKASGKGLSLSEIDLPSFKKAADVCNTIVLSGATVGGSVWLPTDGSRTSSSRDIPLYECNIVIDTAKAIRSNIESILATMGDARLVWSQGKYKLLLQYPATNEAIDLAGTITEDELVLGAPINIKWPSSSDRYNNVTVRYHNESVDFREDSVSWPAKVGGTYKRGIGTQKYSISSGNHGTSDAAVLLNDLGVWSGEASSSTMTWSFITQVSGTHTIKFSVDDSVTISVGGSNFSGGYNTIHTGTFSASANTVVTLTANCTDTGGKRGFAGYITGPNGARVWDTRSVAYTSFINVDTTTQATLYNTFLTEDNSIQLETDIFAEGITDYYHALAKAEELVRTSRSAFSITFQYLLKSKFYEPGDIVKLIAPSINFEEGVYLRITELKVNENGVCDVTASRFDYSQLAWNVADDQYLPAVNLYNRELPAPAWLVYSNESTIYLNSAGTLTWAPVLDNRAIGYIIYAAKTGSYDERGMPLFIEIGRAASDKELFELPALTFEAGIFGIKTYGANGLLSKMTMSQSGTLLQGEPPPTPILLTCVASETKPEVLLTWQVPGTRDMEQQGGGQTITVGYKNHALTTIWRSKTTNIADAKKIGESKGNDYTDTDAEYGELTYWIKYVTTGGRTSAPSNAKTASFKVTDGAGKDTTPPPAPYDLTATDGYNYIPLNWSNPVHNIGGGHDHSIVYAAKWTGTTEPVFGQAVIVAKPTDPYYSFFANLGEKYTFWIKEVSKGGGISTGAAGPATASTAVDVAKIIAALSGQITESQLSQALNTKLTDLQTGVTTATTTANNASSQITTVAAVANSASSTANSASNTAGNAYAAVQTETTARINADNTLFAQYTVKLDVNGYIAGYGLVNDGATSAFGVRADRFWIGSPGASSSYPFIVDSGGVYINDAYIRNGTITSAKIGNAAINNAHINDLQVTTLKIGANAVTQAKFWSHSWSTAVNGISEVEIFSVPFNIAVDNSKMIIMAATPLYVSDSTSVAVRLIVKIDGVTYTEIGVTSDGTSNTVFANCGAENVTAGNHTVSVFLSEVAPWLGYKPLNGNLSVTIIGAFR